MTVTLKDHRLGCERVTLEVDKDGVYKVATCYEISDPLWRVRDSWTYGNKQSAMARYRKEKRAIELANEIKEG